MADTEIADLLEDDEEPTEEVEETDEYGNPPGTEYDENGDALPEIEEVEEEAEVPAPAPRAPAAFAVPTGYSPDDREYLETIFTPQQWAAIEGHTNRAFAAGQASVAAANASVENTLADASPEYRRLVTPRINAVLSRMTPEQRSDPRSGEAALIYAIAGEAEETGESVMQVMARHVQMRGGTAPVKAKTAIAPKPAAVRAPYPSNAGRGANTRSMSGNSSRYKLIAEGLGITAAEAERMGL